MSQGAYRTMDNVNASSLILYTSGKHRAAQGRRIQSRRLDLRESFLGGTCHGMHADDRVLVAVPLAHSLGLNGGLLAPLLSGATVVVLERFTSEAVFAAVKKYRVTVLPAVATIFRRLLNSPAFSESDFSSLRLQCPARRLVRGSWPLNGKKRRPRESCAVTA